MKQIRTRLALLFCSAFIAPALHGVLLVTGPTGTTDTTTTSNNAILNMRQHKPSGMLVLTTTGSNSNNAIMTISRPTTTDTAVTATGIAADSTLRNGCITHLAIVNDPTTPGDSSKAKIVVSNGATGLETALYCLTTTVGTPTTVTLGDTAASTTSRIIGLTGGNAGTTSCAFAAVYRTGLIASACTNWGLTSGDGIASVTINNTTLAMAQVNTATSYAITPTIISSTTTLPSMSIAAGTAIPMAYDQDLKKLYVGLPGIVTNSTSTDIAWGVAVFRVSSDDGTLTASNPLNSNTAATARTVLNGETNIIGTEGASKTLAIKNLRVMTTSTGPSSSYRFKYLILNGGHGAASAVGNQVWAVPLTIGNDDVTIDGYAAKVTSGDFKAIASGASDLYTTSSAAAQVGNGNLPITAATSIADMYVDGDAVYVSVNTTAVGAGDLTGITPGLFVSQAIFDNLGKIAGWTDWHKIAPQALGNTEAANRVDKFTVDAVTGHIIAVDGSAKTAVRMTQWSNTSKNQDGTANTKGLVYNLNLSTNVGDGCTSVCDLNSSTTGWNQSTPVRLAMFGGKSGKVCFAITGTIDPNYLNGTTNATFTATNTEHTFDTSSSTAALDYSSSSTLTLTTLPTGAGTVRALAYSNWAPVSGNTTPGFFLAGAETGSGNGALYAMCAASLGVGMNPVTAWTTTNPVANAAFSWQQLTNVDGVPTKIQTQGQGLYILTRKVNSDGTCLDRIYRATKKSTGATLNADFLVTASSGETSGAVDLSAVKHIYDFVITQTGGTSGAPSEQLTMITNDGIYTTTSATGTENTSYTPANAMLNCGWVKVSTPTTATNFMLKIFEPTHTRAPRTFWAPQWQASVAKSTVYDKTSLAQYGSSISTYAVSSLALGQDGLTNFNGYDGTTTVPTGLVELPIVKTFFSDGSRRFAESLTRSSSASAVRTLTLPFRVDSSIWNRTAPYTITDAALQNMGNIYWIQPIAGILMMGTSKGVVGQQ